MRIAPLSHSEPLHAQVYDQLWAHLAAGTLAVGERLRDTDWSERLGVSRTPVREALRKLAHDGVLDEQSIGGYRVHTFEPEELDGLYRCRAALEALIADEAASRRDSKLLSQLHANVVAAEAALAADDMEALQELNGSFHAQLIDACANTHLRRLLDQTRRLVQIARRQVLTQAASAGGEPSTAYRISMRTVVAGHRAIYETLAVGDAARAATLMRSHILSTAQDMMQLMRACDSCSDAA
jgi:DNA-binding GntR family transcriptional regulator